MIITVQHRADIFTSRFGRLGLGHHQLAPESRPQPKITLLFSCDKAGQRQVRRRNIAIVSLRLCMSLCLGLSLSLSMGVSVEEELIKRQFTRSEIGLVHRSSRGIIRQLHLSPAGSSGYRSGLGRERCQGFIGTARGVGRIGRRWRRRSGGDRNNIRSRTSLLLLLVLSGL